MKIFILLLIVGFVTAVYKIKSFDDLIKYHDECGTELHTPAETLAHYKDQNYTFGKDSYCHVACLAKKIGVFDDEHGLNVDNLVAQVAAASHKTVDEVKPKIVACADGIAQFKDDHCLWAIVGLNCTKQAGFRVIERWELATRFDDQVMQSMTFNG